MNKASASSGILTDTERTLKGGRALLEALIGETDHRFYNRLLIVFNESANE